MKQNNLFHAIAATGLLFSLSLNGFSQTAPTPKSFHKGAFRINLSEGNTNSTYSTVDIKTGARENTMREHGDRDPLSFEYGISDHFGIGISMGNDIFKNMNTLSFYGSQVTDGAVKATTTELTIDGSYHFFVTPVSDFSLVGSFGPASVSIKGGTGDNTYQYNAGGGMVRIGLHARCFLLRYVGALFMVSAYSEGLSPVGQKGNTFGTGYSTTVSGVCCEGGLCFRFRR